MDEKSKFVVFFLKYLSELARKSVVRSAEIGYQSDNYTLVWFASLSLSAGLVEGPNC